MNSNYQLTHEQGRFGEEVIPILAQSNSLGEDVSSWFTIGRAGVDAAFLATGEVPTLTLVETKVSHWTLFPYAVRKQQGGPRYFYDLLESHDSKYRSIQQYFEKLIGQYPNLVLHFIRAEIVIDLVEDTLTVNDIKIKDWNQAIRY
ncbi:hypothetical protein [Paenibacillus sp. Z6-24]